LSDIFCRKAITKNRTLQKKLKTALLMTATLTALSSAIIGPALPKISQALSGYQQSDFISKVLLTLPALLIALFSPLAGLLIDRYGRIRLLEAAILLYALAGSSGFFFNELTPLATSRIFLGLAVAFIMPIVTALVGDYFCGEDRDRYMSLQSAFMALGGMAFIALAGWLAKRDWHYPFLIYSLGLLVLPMVVFWLHEPKRNEQDEQCRVSTQHDKKLFFLILTTAFITMAVFFMIPVQLPFLLRELGVPSPVYAALAIVTGTLAAALGSLIYSPLRRKLHFSQMYALAFGITALGYGLTALAEGWYSVLLSMVITGFGVGLLMPNPGLWIMEIIPAERRGHAMGRMSSAFFLGQFASPLLVAPLTFYFSLSSTFGLVGFVLVFISAGYFWYSRKKQQTTA